MFFSTSRCTYWFHLPSPPGNWASTSTLVNTWLGSSFGASTTFVSSSTFGGFTISGSLIPSWSILPTLVISSCSFTSCFSSNFSSSTILGGVNLVISIFGGSCFGGGGGGGSIFCCSSGLISASVTSCTFTLFFSLSPTLRPTITIRKISKAAPAVTKRAVVNLRW